MNIHSYHFIWYILGFLFAPRTTLAVLLTVYLPVNIWIKIVAWVLVTIAICGNSKVKK